jgi:hypothetical protein
MFVSSFSYKRVRAIFAPPKRQIRGRIVTLRVKLSIRRLDHFIKWFQFPMPQPTVDRDYWTPQNSIMRRSILFVVAVLSLFLVLITARQHHAAEPATAASAGTNLNAEITALKSEVARLKGMATDQSHVMADVGYHFGNLWFAGEKKNWPLAKFYFDETRSHINWAVRVIPVRKDSSGKDVDLKSIWQAIDSGLFLPIGSAIEQKDEPKFSTAYRAAMEGCYTCHKSSSKPYLRPQIPVIPTQPIINFDPDAKWPQ